MDVATVAQDIMTLGARPWAAAIAAQVYMDLCEVKRLVDVQYSYEKSLDLLYILGKHSNSDEVPTVYIPVLSFANISGKWISKVLNTVDHCKKSKSITVAIRQEDTTIVYYSLTSGLVYPKSPEERKKEKNIEDRVKSHDSIINKRKKELFELALKTAEQKQKIPHSEKVEIPEQSHENNKSIVTETCTAESVKESQTDVTTMSDQPSGKELENIPCNGDDKEMVISSATTSEQTGVEHEIEQKDKKELVSRDENKSNNVVELEKEHAVEQELITLDEN